MAVAFTTETERQSENAIPVALTGQLSSLQSELMKWAIHGILAFFFFATISSAQVQVRSYTKKDGTYVPGHQRSNPDGNFYNNWSTKGNINPYTGTPGTRVTPPPSYRGSTYKAPTYTTPSYRAPSYSTPTYRNTAPAYGGKRSR